LATRKLFPDPELNGFADPELQQKSNNNGNDLLGYGMVPVYSKVL
jgi:hypothetical protein